MSSKQEGSASLWNVPVPKVTESPGGSKDTSSSTAAATTNATQPASTEDEQRTHREGIEHLKQNTAQPSHLESSAATGAADRNQPPSSNPSSQDPSGGISGGGVAAVGAGAAAAGGAVAATAAHGNNQTQSQTSNSPQPPASNPADDASGGIGKGHGGVSTAAYTTSPVGEHDTTASAEQAGILGTVKSYLGLSQGGEAGVQQDTSRNNDLASADKKDNSSDSNNNNTNTNDSNSGGGYVAGISAAVASTAAALTGSKQQQPATSEAASASAASDKGTYLNYSGTSSSGDTASAPTSSLVDRTVETVKQYTTGTTNPSSSTTDTSSNDNPSGSADPAKDNSTTGRNMGDTDEQPQHKSTPTDKAAATRENKDAIPTAGGERLGEKHWGESKIVPDNPKPAAEGAGVSSSEGQPNDETVANTAANTGGSTGPPGSSSTAADDHSASGGKPKTLDKIKDKLNIGSKKD